MENIHFIDFDPCNLTLEKIEEICCCFTTKSELYKLFPRITKLHEYQYFIHEAYYNSSLLVQLLFTIRHHFRHLDLADNGYDDPFEFFLHHAVLTHLILSRLQEEPNRNKAYIDQFPVLFYELTSAYIFLSQLLFSPDAFKPKAVTTSKITFNHKLKIKYKKSVTVSTFIQ
jgi:hypothetical protein